MLMWSVTSGRMEAATSFMINLSMNTEEDHLSVGSSLLLYCLWSQISYFFPYLDTALTEWLLLPELYTRISTYIYLIHSWCKLPLHPEFFSSYLGLSLQCHCCMTNPLFPTTTVSGTWRNNKALSVGSCFVHMLNLLHLCILHGVVHRREV